LALERWWVDAVLPYFAAPESAAFPFLRPE
jgi:hypothetical protein